MEMVPASPSPSVEVPMEESDILMVSLALISMAPTLPEPTNELPSSSKKTGLPLSVDHEMMNK
jgi:hypothetical protein